MACKLILKLSLPCSLQRASFPSDLGSGTVQSWNSLVLVALSAGGLELSTGSPIELLAGRNLPRCFRQQKIKMKFNLTVVLLLPYFLSSFESSAKRPISIAGSQRIM